MKDFKNFRLSMPTVFIRPKGIDLMKLNPKKSDLAKYQLRFLDPSDIDDNEDAHIEHDILHEADVKGISSNIATLFSIILRILPKYEVDKVNKDTKVKEKVKCERPIPDLFSIRYSNYNKTQEIEAYDFSGDTGEKLSMIKADLERPVHGIFNVIYSNQIFTNNGFVDDSRWDLALLSKKALNSVIEKYNLTFDEDISCGIKNTAAKYALNTVKLVTEFGSEISIFTSTESGGKDHTGLILQSEGFFRFPKKVKTIDDGEETRYITEEGKVYEYTRNLTSVIDDDFDKEVQLLYNVLSDVFSIIGKSVFTNHFDEEIYGVIPDDYMITDNYTKQKELNKKVSEEKKAEEKKKKEEIKLQQKLAKQALKDAEKAVKESKVESKSTEDETPVAAELN